MKDKKLNLLLTLLYAGWGPIPTKSSRIKGILALQKGDTVAFVRKRVVELRLYKKGVPIAQVLSVSYQHLRLDPYDPFTIINLPPYNYSFDLKKPAQGLIKPPPNNDGVLLKMHDLLCELTVAMKEAPNKTTLVRFMKPRLHRSGETINRLLGEGEGRYWMMSYRKRSSPGRRSIIYRPSYLGGQ